MSNLLKRILSPVLTLVSLSGLSVTVHGLEMVWEILPGRARDIGVGPDGSVWIVGSASEDGDVFHWNGSGWDLIGGSGVLIAVGPQGDPWVVNSDADMYHRINNKWILTTASGSVTGVGVGADGTVLVTGGSFDFLVDYDKPLYRYTPAGGFAPLFGLGRVIEPDGDGWWLLDGDGDISRWLGGPSYIPVEGHAKDISRGALGDVWIVGTNGRIYRWNGQQFEISTTGQAKKISVAPDGSPWLVGSNGSIYRGHLLSLAAGDTIVMEGGSLQFPITLSYPSDRPASVVYQVFGPDDTLVTSGTLNFAPGQTLLTIAVATVPDTVVNGVRVYHLQLAGATGAGLERSLAIGTVLDDDVAAPVLLPSVTPGGGIIVRCDSRLNFNYLLQRRDTLGEGATWIPTVTLTGTGGPIELRDESPPGNRAFYRVLVSSRNP